MTSFSQAAADFRAAQASGDPTAIRVAADALRTSPEAARARQQANDRVAAGQQPRSRS